MANEPDGGKVDRSDVAERLMRLRAGPEAGYAALQSEILRERAISYSRAVDKVENAYAALAEAERVLDAAPTDQRAACLAQCDAAREVTLQVRWELLVQREALGMLDGEEFERTWPFPRRRR